MESILESHVDKIIKLLDEMNERPNARMGYNVSRPKWLPGYCIKHGISRIANAERLRKIIKEYNLDLLLVADEQIYQLPSTRTEPPSDKNCIVLSKIEHGSCGKGTGISHEHVRQLLIIVIKANYYDMHCANYMLRSDNKLVLLDTDDLAMPTGQELAELQRDYMLNGDSSGFGKNECGTRMNPDIINNPLQKMRLGMMSKWPNYSDDAYSFLWKIGRNMDLLREKYHTMTDIDTAIQGFDSELQKLIDEQIDKKYSTTRCERAIWMEEQEKEERRKYEEHMNKKKVLACLIKEMYQEKEYAKRQLNKLIDEVY